MKNPNRFYPAHLAPRRIWGIYLVALIALLAIVQAVLQPIPAHYQMFIGASQAFWSIRPAYGVPFVGNLFFYSPACALFFFGPFSLLPEKLGLLCYLIVSSAVFIYGLISFLKHFTSIEKTNPFWLLIAQPVFSAVGAHKLEVIMMGVLFWSASQLLDRKSATRSYVAAFLMAMIINWKLQPIPSVGLLLLAMIIFFDDLIWATVLGFSLLFWFLVPFIVAPGNYLIFSYFEWKRTLADYSRISYVEFDNLYSFFNNSLRIPMSYPIAQTLSLIAGVVIGAGFAYWSLSHSKERGAFYRAILLGLAMGAAYAVLFSPLQQIQAYILLTPALFLGWMNFDQAKGPERKFWKGLLIVVGLVLCFAYSDLVPQPLREVLRHLTVRSGAVLVLTVALAIRPFSGKTGWLPKIS